MHLDCAGKHIYRMGKQNCSTEGLPILILSFIIFKLSFCVEGDKTPTELKILITTFYNFLKLRRVNPCAIRRGIISKWILISYPLFHAIHNNHSKYLFFE